MEVQKVFGIAGIVQGKPCILSIPLIQQVKRWQKEYGKINKKDSLKYQRSDYLCLETDLHGYTLQDRYHLPCCYIMENLKNPHIQDADEDEMCYQLYPVLLPQDGVPFADGEMLAGIDSVPQAGMIRWQTIHGITIALDPVLHGTGISLLQQLRAA